MTRTRTLITGLIAGFAAAATAAPAGAATQSLAGTLEDGRLVTFTSEAPAALSTPRVVRGMQPREQIVALGSRAGRVFALASAARLYALDVDTGRATPVAGGREIAQGLRGRAFSLAITPDGARARVLSDVGQDVFVDLATGDETPGPGVRTADGTGLRPAGAIGDDGRLVGVDLQRRMLVRETGPGSGVVSTQGLQIFRDGSLGIVPPASFAAGAGGRGYLVGPLSDEGRNRQSRMLTVDLATGQVLTLGNGFFARRVATVTAVREVPEDRTAPQARISVPARMSLRRLLVRRRVPVLVRSPEAVEVSASFRFRGPARARRVALAQGFRDTPGPLAGLRLYINVKERRFLTRVVGDRVQLALTLRDDAGNARTIFRSTRLVR